VSLHTTIGRQHKRVRLGAKTVSVLNALSAHDQAGATAAELAPMCSISPRSTVARLRWLKRVGCCNCRKGTWTVADNALFRQQTVSA
jgi:hypothetical protein